MSAEASSSIPEVTTDELRDVLDLGEPVHVLDVRPREQYEDWHVPGSRHVGGYEALKDGREGEAVVVDPALSPEVYETQAEERGWSIVGVVDTHIHADHLSRAQTLADATGAPLYLPEQDRVSFEHASLTGGDTLDVGSATVEVLHTPGHTPESTTYRLGDEALFTGDTLFLKGVGRPDLDADAEQGRRKARQLYRSLQRLARHPGDTTVLPGHASEPVPFDGEIVGAPLRAVNGDVEALQWSEEQFVGPVTENAPPTPPNHETVIAANTTGDWPTGDVVDLEAGGNRCAVG